MNVKRDTKEKFTVITPIEGEITANMTGELKDLLLSYTNKTVPHVILDMKHVEHLPKETVEIIAGIQQSFYEKNHSFVICGLKKSVEAVFKEADFFDIMNITPTESEAWDILQMEEIERELMDNFDNNSVG